MTREAVIEGFERFVGDAIEETIAEFSLSRALQNGVSGPGRGAIDRLLKNSETVHRTVVQPELESYREQVFDQFAVILTYADSGGTFDNYCEEILAADAFASSLRPGLSETRRVAVQGSLLTRHRQLGDAVTPLVESPEPRFWDAARTELDRGQAETLVEEHFAFTRPLRDHQDALQLETTVDIGEVVGGFATLLGRTARLDVDYTDEAIRAMCHAEQAVIRDAKREVDRQFRD